MTRAKILANAGFVGDGDQPIEAVAVTGERIAYAGSLAGAKQASPGNAEVVDLDGATVFAGFADSHVHVLNFGRSRMGVSCWPSEVSSVGAIVDKVRAAHDGEPPGKWLRGRGYDPSQLAEGRAPTAAELDLPDGRCVVIDSFDFHRRVANQAALSAAGIDESTPDPPGGHIARDQSGRPTGELLDSARALLDGVMPPWSEEEDEVAIERATDHFLSLGFTQVTNSAPLTMSNLGEEVAAFSRLRERGELRLRFTSMMRIDLVDSAIDLGVAPGLGDDRFRLGGLKLFADGAFGPRTAYLQEPYLDEDTHGYMAIYDDELDRVVGRAAQAGWQVCVHAIGDAATRTVARVLGDNPLPGGSLRHRIEHCCLTDPETIGVIAGAGLVPVPQLGFLRFRSADFVNSLGEERLARMFPLRSWIDAGIHPIHSSDAPVIEDARPIAAVATAITRADAAGDVWGRDEAITIGEALAMLTTWAAEAAGQHGDRGRIAPGYLADFTAFDVDPRQVPPGELQHLEPSATIVGGDLAWSRP